MEGLGKQKLCFENFEEATIFAHQFINSKEEQI